MHQPIFSIAVALIILFAPASAQPSGYSFGGAPLLVREELLPAKAFKGATFMITRTDLEQYLATREGYRGFSVTGTGSEKEQSWNEFQYRNFLFRMSRYRDVGLPKSADRFSGEDAFTERIKALPSQLGAGPNRDALETLEKIFTPQLDLGIVF